MPNASTTATGICGQIAAPIPLADGRLLAFYVHRRAPGSMRLVLSEDAGATWDTAHELVVYDSTAGRERGVDDEHEYSQYWDDMNAWTFGHPAGVALADGSVLLAYYGGPHNKCLSARWARITVSTP